MTPASTYQIPDQLSDTYKFELGGLQLYQNLKSWSDKIAFRLAVHRYLKRDGAELEHMGRDAAEFSLQCYFMGPTWRAEYARLVNMLSDNPLRKMVHPLLGPMDVGVELITAGCTPANARNLVEFTLQVREDRVDVKPAAEDRPTPNQLQGQVTEQTGVLSTDILPFAPDTQGEVMSAISAAIVYASFAAAQANSILISSDLAAHLDEVGARTQAAIERLIADPRGDDASKFDQLALLEGIFSTCIEMDNVVRALRPEPETKVVEHATSLMSLCERWYGARDAATYFDLILSMNRVPTPHSVPPQTVLVVPPVVYA